MYVVRAGRRALEGNHMLHKDYSRLPLPLFAVASATFTLY